MVNPEDQRARTRSALGLTRELQVGRTNAPHPARGGARGYAVHERQAEIDAFHNREPIRASLASIYRWMERLEPHRMTGNKEKEKLVGAGQMLLVIFLYAFPDAHADEIATFIWNESGELYDLPTISKRLKELHMTKKRASTEAYQAYTPANLLRARWFWEQPPPLGVFQISRRRLIDIDEAGFELTRVNRKYGHSITSVRIRKQGHYTRDTKLTVILAIEPGDPTLPANISGSMQNPRRWIRVNDSAGTSAVEFANFCDIICTNIEQNPSGPNDGNRIMMWDNLSSHLSPHVTQVVEGRNQIPNNPTFWTIVRRPPYQPKFGPIEYIFCELACELKKIAQANWDTAKLRQEIFNIAARIGRGGAFDRTFEHCGYDP